ncbi:AdeC/AdeK/OprM family multidrug efflux complex outer membrane factor [Pseudomonas sp. GCM10022188]|uniref:AdeC/AdeK/OprM family multidrug efflux complex outer membrane factor n=1 Tax=Pseudomonas TaxID=286 RepID=UPI001E60D41B|nr:AdeC/AdeK/OprM family multidrug efflux complex outer membrane factor [Pseudomonas oryzagri]MCC6074305.1 AdeC/AdeK/OprM family multidrug efflux complex outer membrane factor [Pseudomonas oryzagri]
MKKSILTLSILLALGGCSLIPDYQRPEAPVADAWPKGPAYAAEAGQAGAELPAWRSFFRDAALQRAIQVALDNNRDLRVAALNVEAYQALHRIQRAELFPQIDARGSGTRQRLPGDLSRTGEAATNAEYGATVGVSDWELDLFGRLRSLSEAALEQYFATAQAQRSTQIALVASVADAWLTLQADRELLALSEETLRTYEQSLALTQRSFDVGVASALELTQSRSAVESARVSVAQYTRLVAQDRNALQLLLGNAVPDDLPAAAPLEQAQLAELPVGLPAELLQRRPDILEAEHLLKAANANIGAARAAFFPSISLTGRAGTTSTELSGLFKAGSGTWLFQPSINLPIFTAGSLKGSLDYAKLQKQIEVAQYEKAIQTAFSEVADGLAARSTYTEQLKAQRDLVAANAEYYRLAERRYRTGVDSHLILLDAQRQLFGSQQTLIGDRLAQLSSEIALYKALGGGVE